MKTLLPSLIFALLLTGIRGEVVTLAHSGETLPPKSTVVWSPLFQATWDKLNADFGGPPVRVEPPNDLMAKLDKFKWDAAKVMPDGSWKTWSGPATRDFLDQVNQQAAAITKEPEGPFKLLNEDPQNRAAFGLLDREVAFQKEFFPSTKLPMKFRAPDGEHPVRFFGVRDELTGEFEKSVRVLAWRPADRSHAIQIQCKQADDTVILYLPPKHQDFATACRWLRTWRSDFMADAPVTGAWNDNRLHIHDEIQIPYVTLESNSDLAPRLRGLRFFEKEKLPWTITRAEQLTRFKLHEKGARVRVEVSLEAGPFGPSPSEPLVVPRRFLYDRPFFFFLWRDQAEWPYFGAWIGDASALTAFP